MGKWDERPRAYRAEPITRLVLDVSDQAREEDAASLCGYTGTA